MAIDNLSFCHITPNLADRNVKWEWSRPPPPNSVGASIILCVEHTAMGVTSTCRSAQEVRLSKDSTYRWGIWLLPSIHYRASHIHLWKRQNDGECKIRRASCSPKHQTLANTKAVMSALFSFCCFTYFSADIESNILIRARVAVLRNEVRIWLWVLCNTVYRPE